jgi:hypothetical protein
VACIAATVAALIHHRLFLKERLASNIPGLAGTSAASHGAESDVIRLLDMMRCLSGSQSWFPLVLSERSVVTWATPQTQTAALQAFADSPLPNQYLHVVKPLQAKRARALGPAARLSGFVLTCDCGFCCGTFDGEACVMLALRLLDHKDHARNEPAKQLKELSKDRLLLYEPQPSFEPLYAECPHTRLQISLL